MAKENNVFVSNDMDLPEHPVGRAYIEKCNAEAAALSKEELLRMCNYHRSKVGLPPRSMESFLKEYF